MTVPTIPLIGQPYLWILRFLDYGGEALVLPLLCVTFLGAFYTLVKAKVLCKIAKIVQEYKVNGCKSCKKNRKKPLCNIRSADFGRKCTLAACWVKCKSYLKIIKGLLSSFYILGSRILNVKLFPGLFTEHKARINRPRHIATGRFILFLHRDVENNGVILFAFYFLTLAILSSALLAFFRHFPVAISEECLERDAQLRTLFCYTNESTLPVDCAIYNDTQLEEIEFVCYAITIPSIGIATAAATGLAKVATVSITIYIRVSEGIYMWSRGNTRRYCRLSPECLYIFYLVATLSLLTCISIIIYIIVAVISVNRLATVDGHLAVRLYFAYAILPLMLIPSLITIMCALGRHCDQQEYISFSNDQVPICKRNFRVRVIVGDEYTLHVEEGNVAETAEQSLAGRESQ